MSEGIDRATAQWYVETALVRLLAKADELVDAGGDELLSRRPDLEAGEVPRGPVERYEGEPEVIT